MYFYYLQLIYPQSPIHHKTNAETYKFPTNDKENFQ